MNFIYYSWSLKMRSNVFNPSKQMGHILFSNDDFNFPIRTDFVEGKGGGGVYILNVAFKKNSIKLYCLELWIFFHILFLNDYFKFLRPEQNI